MIEKPKRRDDIRHIRPFPFSSRLLATCPPVLSTTRCSVSPNRPKDDGNFDDPTVVELADGGAGQGGADIDRSRRRQAFREVIQDAMEGGCVEVRTRTASGTCVKG